MIQINNLVKKFDDFTALDGVNMNVEKEANEELLETEELTKTEAEALYEEATGLLRAVMELTDRLEGKGGEKGADEFRKMLNTQRLIDEKRWQELIKSLK